MKRTLILMFFFLFALTAVSFAADEENSRWFWVRSNNELSAYIDKKTIEYDVEDDVSSFWVMWDRPAEKMRIIQNIKIDYRNKTFYELSYNVYEYDKGMPIETNNNYRHIIKVIPNTFSDTLYERSAELVGRDEQLAAYEKEKEEAAAAKEQERKKQERQKKQKDVANAITGALGIGGLF